MKLIILFVIFYIINCKIPINIGIFIQYKDFLNYKPDLIYNSVKLSIENSTFEDHDITIKEYKLINENDCENYISEINFEEIAVIFSYTDYICAKLLYDKCYEKDVFLISPYSYIPNECIKKNSVFGGLFVHMAYNCILFIHLVLRDLFGNFVLITSENSLSGNIVKNMLNIENDYYNLYFGCNVIENLIYSNDNNFYNHLKDIVVDDVKILIVVDPTIIKELLDGIKLNINDAVDIYLLSHFSCDILYSNLDLTSFHMINSYLSDYKNTVFGDLYYETYNSDEIFDMMYISFYMMKHWIDSLKKVLFYKAEVILSAYNSNIITPEVTLYYHENNFFYGNYYLITYNNNNVAIEKEYNPVIHSDYRQYSAVIGKINSAEICEAETKSLIYILIIHNYYECNENSWSIPYVIHYELGNSNLVFFYIFR